MIGRSKAHRELLCTLRRLAPMRQPVLLRGESGTGKELAARALHEQSPRGAFPFVAVNCAAIAAGIAESELFGHTRGAFTGAHRDHAGAFRRADRGTLFLDEVAELPLPLQATLLRALEVGAVTPVGGEAELTVAVRVVAATHRPLERMVMEGRFREDLYHRLGVLVVHLPPLRDRPDDVTPLLDYFAAQASEELGRDVVFEPDAIARAVAHPWPGNVRALRNAVLRAAALSDGPVAASMLIPNSLGPLAGGMTVARGSYADMRGELLASAVKEHGSIRKAARALGVPRSTLAAWLKH